MSKKRIEGIESLNYEIAVNGLKAIAHPGRLKILCALIDAEKTVGDLVEVVDLSQSAVSQHLSKMKAANVLQDRRDGNQVYYSLKRKEYEKLVTSLCDIYLT